MEKYKSIYDTAYNNVEYGMDRTRQGSTISVSPYVDTYEEATTEDITQIYNRQQIYELLAKAFRESPYYEKYGKLQKKRKQRSADVSLLNDNPPIIENNIKEIDVENANTTDVNIDEYDFKKIEKGDLTSIYYYFKNILEEHNFDEMESFCAIAEFFKLNYKLLYDDVISIESKAKILNALKDNFNIKFENMQKKTQNA